MRPSVAQARVDHIVGIAVVEEVVVRAYAEVWGYPYAVGIIVVVGGIVGLTEADFHHGDVAVVEVEFAGEFYQAVVLAECAHHRIPYVDAH